MKKLAFLLAMAVWGHPQIILAETKPVTLNSSQKSSINNENGHKRTPVLIPTAFIDGHTLTFDSSCIGCTVTVLEDDIVVFCGTIDEEGTLILPDCLEGTFTIELQRGSITFVGEIEVE